MDIRPIERRDVPAVARSLAAAFEDDPFSRWAFGPHDLRNRLRRSFELMLRIVYVRKKRAYTTPGLEGAALWSAPGRHRLGIVEQLRMAPGYLRILGSHVTVATRAFAVVDRAHPPEPHWYLTVLGVAPSRQRSGLGTSLLRPMLERADTERTLTYLETFKLDNVGYYERFGFEVRGEDDIPDGGPHMWSMSRRPFAGRG